MGISMAAHLPTIDQKLPSLLSLRESVDCFLMVPAEVNQLLELKPTANFSKETVKDLQTSLDFLPGRCDGVLPITTSNEKDL